MREHPLIMKNGILLRPTLLDDLECFIALLASVAEIGAVVKLYDETENRDAA
jgi:hypothetical protein